MFDSAICKDEVFPALSAAVASLLEPVRGRPGAVLAAEIRELTTLSRRLDAAVAVRILDFDRQGLAAGEGSASTSAWLRREGRLDPGAASRIVKTARTMDAMPLLGKAFRDGLIGSDHVQAVGFGAGRVPVEGLADADAVIAEFAGQARPSELRRVAQRLQACYDEAAVAKDHAAVYESRELALAQTFDGAWHLQGRLDPVGGASLQAALEPYLRRQGAEDSRTLAQRRADGLLEVVGLGLRSGELPDAGGDRPRVTLTLSSGLISPGLIAAGLGLRDIAGAVTGSGLGALFSPSGGAPSGAPDEVSGPPGGAGLGVSVGLAAGVAVAGFGEDSAAHLLGSGALLPGETIARICCDADQSVVVLDTAGEILSYGRERRLPSRAQRRALVVRDGGCVFPGCDRPPSACEAHHLVYWSRNGSTDLDNLALVCAFHHYLVHEAGWTLTRELSADTGEFAWVATDPDGRQLRQRRRPAA